MSVSSTRSTASPCLPLILFCCHIDYANKYEVEWIEYQNEVREMIIRNKRKNSNHNESKRKDLPFETVVEIFQFFDANSLAIASQVCQDWNFLSQNDMLWEKNCQSKFNISKFSFRSESGDFTSN
jgi:hypothetical protein